MAGSPPYYALLLFMLKRHSGEQENHACDCEADIDGPS
jgi:hypothetical protein